MKNYIIIHRHKYGSSVYLGEAETLPTEKQVVKTFDIDFEPDKEEYIEIFESTPKPIKTIKQ